VQAAKDQAEAERLAKKIDDDRKKIAQKFKQPAEKKQEAKKNRVGAFAPDVETASAEGAPDKPAEQQLAIPIIPERDIVLAYTIPVFSMKEPFQQIGNLQRGAQVRVLGAESASMIRIRFTGAEGKVFEAQCRRVDVGL
jgi:hypothetical protein